MKTSPIVFLIRNIGPEEYGGAESYQIELAKVLQKNGYTPIIYTASKKTLANAKAEGIKAVRAPYNKRQNWSGWRNILLPKYLVWQHQLCRWYKKQILKYHPIMIDIQSRDEWIAATKAGRRTNTKVIWTDHIDFRTWVLQNVNCPFKNFIGKKIIKIATIPKKIIFISDYEKQSFEKTIAPKVLRNLTVMKNGVMDVKKEFVRQNPAKQNFCYVGRLVDYKGIQELIEAFKIVNSQYPDTTLNIYGEGRDANLYHKLAKDSPGIIFHGYTNNPLQAIAESEFFVLPSYYEGLSITLLQAAMLGKMIIATNVDGNPEVVENDKTGILVPPHNSKALAEAMIKAISNPGLVKQCENAVRQKYEQEFNFEHTVLSQFIQYIEE